MSKSNYTDEELEQLFQNLFIEKKKVKELEQKLQLLHQEHEMLICESRQISLSHKTCESEEIEKLKALVVTYKKKSMQAIHALYENEHQKIKHETSFAQQIKQLQKQVQELTEENASLGQQKLKSGCSQKNVEHNNAADTELDVLYKDTQMQNRQQKEQIDKLARTLQDREKKIRELQLYEYNYKKNNQNKLSLESQIEQDRASNQTLRAENDKLSEQFHVSQTRLQELNKELHQTRLEKAEAINELYALQSQFATLKAMVLHNQEALKTVSEEKIQIESLLNDKKESFNKLEKEIIEIKQALSKGLNETKDIEGRYLGIVNEKSMLYHKSAHLEQLLDRHNSEIRTLQQQLQEAEKREESVKLQLEQIEATTREKHHSSVQDHQKRIRELETNLRKHHDLLHEKEREIEDNGNKIMQLKQEKSNLENSFTDRMRYQEEQEARIKVAQQHLGKKVKEVTLLNEKIEVQKAQIADLQASLNVLKNKENEMQLSFDQLLQQEIKQREQMQESIRFSDEQSAGWKEKYLNACEKLKNLEEKQHQMKALFANLSNVMGATSFSQTAISLPIPLPSDNQQWMDKPRSFHPSRKDLDSQEENSSTPIQPSLFDIEQPRFQTRQNLFE